jgi:hypothetical protein
MNKTTVIALCFVLVVGVVAGVEALNRSNSLEVVKLDKEVIEVNPNLHLLEDEDAVAAAQEVVDRKKWMKELEAIEATFASSTQVYEAYKAAHLQEKERLEKKIGSY